ncbi:MAG: hypothetical protein ABIT20_06080 [Gemmatimonadaceae bacterium]
MPIDALWSATVGPARSAKLEGKVADLVLLDANPLDNIRNTRAIFGVIQGGRL